MIHPSMPPDLFDRIVRQVRSRRRLPAATYRIQFGPAYTFQDARSLIPYLHDLGISDLYASPCLKAGRNSNHGYDICDHNALNPGLGSDNDFDDLAAELRGRGMGLIFDVVPNHMGIADPANSWWFDVLENGPCSAYARFFDIDWHPLKVEAGYENRLLLPILGDPYGKVLEDGEIRLTYQGGAFFIRYYEHCMPVSPRQYPEILGARIDQLTEELGADDPSLLELQSIITAAKHLPPESETDPEKIAERQREKEISKRRIANLLAAEPAVRAAIEATIVDFNGRRGDRRSFDALDSLLEKQCYRLSYWRVAAEEINYRRFFDVNDLAAIRMELPQVFAETHRLILRLIREGKVTGLRIDHADGLWDPRGYLKQLQKAGFVALASEWLDRWIDGDAEAREAAENWLADRYDAAIVDDRTDLRKALYVVAEKILGRGERLPTSWPIHGTTGYDFADALNGIFVDTKSRKAFADLYAAFLGAPPARYADLVNSSKKMIMLISLASEANELGYQLKRIARRNRWSRDLTLNSLTYAVREIIATLPIYRTYLTGDGAPIEAHDRAAIEAAVGEAKRRNPRTASTVFDFIRQILLQEYPPELPEEEREDWRIFVMRFQQTSGPVMAKGVEDTAFYVDNRLLSLNEVGGDPEQFGLSPAAFHRQNQERLLLWPYSMLAGSTHDSKRSADVRARLNVLSEIPRRWRSAISRWSRQNRAKKALAQGQPAPDRHGEYFIYQTLLGAWPLEPLEGEARTVFCQRVSEYVQKAFHEAKIHTSWVNPNQEYDSAVARFIERILAGRPNRGFLADFASLQGFVAFYGMLNALSQTLVQLTSPGVPDLYQGNELWALSLVDPDNRRPVDYRVRARALAELRERAGSESLSALTAALLQNWTDGRVKLWVIYRALAERRTRPEVFTLGRYLPLEPSGKKKENLFGFLRSDGVTEYAVFVPRLPVALTDGTLALPMGVPIWRDTFVEIPGGVIGAEYVNVLTDERIPITERDGRAGLSIAEALGTFPVALLRRDVGQEDPSDPRADASG